MKRLLAVSLIAASVSLAYAQTAPFDIVKSATVAAKEAKITCKKLAVAPKSCVLAYFDEDSELSKKPSEYYRVLDGKTADGQFVVTDYYSSGELQADAIATSNPQALLSPSAQALNPNAQNYTLYHKNGAKSSTINYTNGLASGVYQRWYDNGTKEAEGTFKNGKPKGEWTYWHENGEVASKGSFNDDGEPTGTRTMWYDNATKEEEGTYKNGERTGAWIYWHENGEVESKGNYNDDGQKTGVWTGWHENGEKSREGTFDEKGEPHGTWTVWDEVGKVVATLVYANGEPISVNGVAVDAAE
jgi:antitoxin component YwqK of YwqJK toxin-antitoxin module